LFVYKETVDLASGMVCWS